METKTNSSIPEVNIRKVFKEKNPGLARVIPGFVYRYIEKVIHQELPKDDPKVRQPDTEKAERILKWKATVPRSDGLKRTLDYFEEFLKTKGII